MKIFDEIDKLQAEINKHLHTDQHLLKQIKEYFRIGLTYSSNAIEGNTLTELETKIVLEEGITPPSFDINTWRHLKKLMLTIPILCC